MLANLRQLILEHFRWIDGDADMAGLLVNGQILQTLGPGLAALFADEHVDVVAAPEARGFVLGALVAKELGRGLVLIRKPGSIHPGPCQKIESGLDWRGQQTVFRLRRGDLEPGQKVLLVDDWVETGSQARACRQLIEAGGAEFVGVAALVQDCAEQLANELNLRAVVEVSELV